MSDNEKNIIERAFELARSGTCKTLSEIKRKLKEDGFFVLDIDGYMSGSSIKSQLTALCRKSYQSVDPVSGI